MEKSREGGRSGNGGFRRRSRSGGLRESPEAALEETTRLRSREARRDRDRERSGHTRRRRGEREDTSEESEEEEEDDDEERASVRMPPPPVSIPRKTRSAYAKRSHENWISGNGAAVELLNRHSNASTSPSREVKASAPTSPSSSNVSIRKKTKPRQTKNPKSPSSIQEIEIEVAEVLFGLTRQFQEPSNVQENNDLNDSTKTAKSTQNSTQSSAAPRRKRPRPLKIEEEQTQKSEEEKTLPDNQFRKVEKKSTSSPARDGGETSVNPSSNPLPEKTVLMEDDRKEPNQSSNGKIDSAVQDLRSEENVDRKEENGGTPKVEAPKLESKFERAISNPSPSTSTPLPLDGRSSLLNNVRPKHCSTHCYIAKSIQYQQQLARMGTLCGPLYGSKPINSSSVLPPPGPKNILTSSTAKDLSASKKKQLPQQHPQAQLFPPAQQHPAGLAKTENPNLGSSLESSDLNPPPASFNYPNLPSSEAQYLLLQNPGYPFQLPAYRGGTHPFFSSSIYLHPSQLQPLPKNPNPSGNLQSTSEDYPQQSVKAAGFPASFTTAMSGPADRRPVVSRPEIDPNAESSSQTLNLIPCSSMNGPRAPTPNQRQLQFHQQQRQLQLQQQQQLQLQQQFAAAQKGKTSSAKYPGSLSQHWKTSSTSSPVVLGRAPPQLSFGGRPPAQQTSQAPRLPPPGQLFFSNPYYQRPPPDQHTGLPPSSSSGGIRGLPPPSLLQAAQFAASSGAHTIMSAAGFPYLHAMPSVPVRPAEHKPAAGK